jgi:hypothetical protein
MTFALARSLLLADALPPTTLAHALLVAATRGTSFVRALLATRAIDLAKLEQQLERGEAPTMRHVAPVMSLVQRLPPGLCERLLALPVRRDPLTGTIDVAVVDARDPHAVEEVAYWLRAPVRMVRTSIVAMDAALRRMQSKPEAGLRALAAPIWVPAATKPPPDVSRTPAYGSPAFDEAQGTASLVDDSPTEVTGFPVADPNIPFSLTRKSHAPVTIIELGEPRLRTAPLADERAEPRRAREADAPADPVLDLRRRKSGAPTGPPATVPPLDPPGASIAGATLPAPPPDDLAGVHEALEAAQDRDSILDLLVAGVRPKARRVAVLAVRRDALVGWTCSPEFGEPGALRVARVALAQSDLLSRTLDSDAPCAVRLPKDAAHAPLLSAMKAPAFGQVVAASVRVEGKAVALVLADDFADAAAATQRIEEVARAAGDALARLLRERRRK